MSLVSQIRKAFQAAPEGPGDMLASLLMAAQEDRELRRRMLLLLRAPGAQRESVINTAIHEMRLRGESQAACAAFALLASEEGAKRALQVLAEK